MVHISNDFFSVLTCPEFDDFTVGQLRDKVQLVLNVPDTELRELYKRSYRVLLRLVKSGHLRPSTAASKVVKYKKTELFLAEEFTTKMKSGESEPLVIPSIKKDLNDRDSTKTAILKMMREHEVDMHAAHAASQLYQEFRSKMPGYDSVLLVKEQQARENSSRLMGRLHALKEILKELDANQK